MCEKLYYKVVKVLPEGELISAFSSFCTAHYKIGQEVFPECGKLFCFDSLSDAEDYQKTRTMSGTRQKYAVYSCRVTSPEIRLESPGKLFTDTLFNLYFSDPTNRKLRPFVDFCRCVICDSITLLEKVEDEEKY